MNELLLLVIYSVGSLISLISVLAVCVCGCRKGAPKNDLLGLDGMVKITNPDENVNHLPAVGNCVPDAENCNTENDEHKRPSAGSNPHRSLPDIPVLASDVNGDTSSELYATVDDKTVSLAYKKRHTLSNGVDAGPSLSHQSSISQSDSNYARLKENPYDKVKKSENPYANVKSSSNKENDESSREPSPQTSWNNISRVAASDSVENISVDQTILERRRASAQSAQNTGNPSPIPDIPAATAVAGRVAASQDLPYMTPPITQPQHFSGDSQDSSRGGYTSISVREPLANIVSQTPAIRNRRTDLDPHYSTVSDDSDEMYAAIVEPNSNIYNGSETYAQIQPITVAVDVHGQSSVNNEPQEDEEDDQYEPAPQPPSVDSLKHVAHVHSRQASSSSCTSSVANLGSPKPEKRQANSPLPPPPAISPDLYSRIDKSNEDAHNLTVVRNLEDMYAKVHKTKKKSDENDVNNTASVAVLTEVSVPQNPENKRNSVDSIDATSNSVGKHLEENTAEHCYETLNKDKAPSKDWDGASGPESLLSNDPGYEQLNPQHRAPSSASDPNYEVLRPQRTSSVCDNSLGYSTIGGKCNKSTLTVNPNYAPVPHTKPGCSLTDDGYSRLHKNKMADEPNYESVPDYATVHKTTVASESEPNYESVGHLCEPDDDDDDGNSVIKYEQIPDRDRSKSSDNSEDRSWPTPDYERIKDSSKSSDNSLDQSDKTPDYQRIKSSETSETESNNNDDQASIILTVTSDITEVKINIPNSVVVHEATDIFHV